MDTNGIDLFVHFIPGCRKGALYCYKKVECLKMLWGGHNEWIKASADVGL